MKVLIIEDDQNKLSQLIEHISKRLHNPFIETRHSYQSGVKELLTGQYNLVIVDMSMPTFDINPQARGGRPRAFAGRDIMRQMDRHNIVAPVIVVTQFEMFGDTGNTLTLSALSEQLAKDHIRIYLGTVYYNAALNNWKTDLDIFLKQAINFGED